MAVFVKFKAVRAFAPQVSAVISAKYVSKIIQSQRYHWLIELG